MYYWSGKHTNLGYAKFTMAQLKEEMKEYEIITPRGAKDKGKYKLTLPRLEIKPRHTFLEYVFGGCEISLAIAIDFT